MPAISYTGSVVSVSAAAPATFNSAGYAALTWTTVGFVADVSEMGDSSADVTFEGLDGRSVHVNGSKDGGAVSLTFRHESDAGQNILFAQNNGNNDVSMRVVDSDAKIHYVTGRVANVRHRARTSSNWKGFTADLRVNTDIVTV
jgi:hypothetical protein